MQKLRLQCVSQARHVFLNTVSGPNNPTPTPNEFPFIRLQLRHFVQRLLERSMESGGRLSTFEAVTERVIAQNLTFLRSIVSIYYPSLGSST